MVMDGKTQASILKSQTKDQGDTLSGSLQQGYPNVITTDASTKGHSATLWQEQLDGKLKPIGVASRFLSDTEKYARNQLELIAVVCGLEQFRLYIYG